MVRRILAAFRWFRNRTSGRTSFWPEQTGKHEALPTAICAQALHHKWNKVLGDDEIMRGMPEALRVKLPEEFVGEFHSLACV